ncbi:MAG: hypothetical protein ABI612_00755 [Betaproteobacteria bacterium]
MLKTVGTVCLAALLSTAAHASLVSWEIVNLNFDDGASARGRFTLDLDSNSITDFDIFTTASETMPTAFEYTPSTARITGQSNTPGASGYPDVYLQLDSLPDVIPGATRELLLSFSSQLVLGGIASILHEGTLGRSSYELQTGGEGGQVTRLVAGPGVVDPPIVPEPAGVVFLAMGLGAVGFVVLSRRRPQRLIESLRAGKSQLALQRG